MIFTAAQIKLIKDGTKTMMRLPVKRGDAFGELKKCLYRENHPYVLQELVEREWTAKTLANHQKECATKHPTRARAVLASIDKPLDADYPTGIATTLDQLITVTSIRREPFSDITLDDVRREGFRTFAQFRSAWHQEHGHAAEVWVISFVLENIADQPHLLRATIDLEHGGDYTVQPALAMSGSLDPGEAPRASQVAAFASAAAIRDDLRERQEQAFRPLTEVIAEIEARALAGDEEARRHLYVINQRVQKFTGNESREAA